MEKETLSYTQKHFDVNDIMDFHLRVPAKIGRYIKAVSAIRNISVNRLLNDLFADYYERDETYHEMLRAVEQMA